MLPDTGLVPRIVFVCQFVSYASYRNILDCPSRGSQPIWAYKPVKERGTGFITPLVFNQ